MTSLKISQLSAAAALDGTELTPLVQGGQTRAASINQLAASVLATVFIGASVTVPNYATLPAASAYIGKFAWVLNSTGFLLTKKASGWYSSDGTAWSPADPPTGSASSVSADTTGFAHSSHNDVQNVLADLDRAIMTAAPGGDAGAIQFRDGAGNFAGGDGLKWDDGNKALALLANASAYGVNSFAVGAANSGDSGSGPQAGDWALAIGGANDQPYTYGADATGIGSMAIGGGSVAAAPYSCAVGPLSYTYDGITGGFALGGGQVFGNNAIAIGPGFAQGDNSFALAPFGYYGCQATGDSAMAFSGGVAEGQGSVAIGTSDGGGTATGDHSIAIGTGIWVTGAYSHGFGLNSDTITKNKFSGANIFAVALSTQNNRVNSLANTMQVTGGNFLFDPTVAPTAAITVSRASFDLGRAVDAAIIPTGTVAQRPAAGVNGMIRYNSTAGTFEGYSGGAWKTFTLT